MGLTDTPPKNKIDQSTGGILKKLWAYIRSVQSGYLGSIWPRGRKVTAHVYCGVGHCKNALQGHCKNALQLGAAGLLCGWAPMGNPGMGCFGDTLRLGTAGIFCGWTVQRYAAARLRAEGEENRDFLGSYKPAA